MLPSDNLVGWGFGSLRVIMCTQGSPLIQMGVIAHALRAGVFLGPLSGKSFSTNRKHYQNNTPYAHTRKLPRQVDSCQERLTG